jgi:uncharacterized protein (UPF0332 family)
MIAATDLLQLAGRLAATAGDDESMCRAAVGRAYYAAFHLTLSFLVELGLDRAARSRNHALMPQCLQASDVAPVVQAGRLLATLQSIRVAADYRLDCEGFGSFHEIRHHIESASEIHDLLDGLAADEEVGARLNISAYLTRRGL